MRHFAPGLALVAAILLAGCGDRLGGGGQARHHGGRYIGIGLYPASALWQHLAGVARPANAQAATLEDDDQVIVVVDSQTGEIRQCGNLSGHCIAMNPWSGRPAPASLDAHAADLAREAAASSTAVTNTASGEINAVAADAAPSPRGRPDRR